jgi:ABC-type multidrug transport system fused ATPase/permease subunit
MSLFKKVFFLISKKKKKELILLSLLLFVGIIFEMGSLGILFPVFELLLNNQIFDKYPFLNDIYIFFGNPTQSQIVIFVMISLLITFLLKNIFLLFLTWKQSKFAIELSEELNNKLFKGYLNQTYSFHIKRNSGELISNIQNEIQQFSSFIQSLIFMSLEIAVLTGVVITLFLIEPLGALFISLIMAFSAFILHYLTKKKIINWGKKRQLADLNINKNLIQSFSGIKDLILNSAEFFFQDKYKKELRDRSKVYIKQLTLMQFPKLYIEFLAIFCMSSLIILMVLINRPLESFLPTVGIFLAAAFRALPSVNKILGSLQNIKFTKTVIDLLIKEFSIIDNNIKPKFIEKIDFKNEIIVKNVNFYYEDSDLITLENINFSIKKGDSIGITGPSGSGKSTLVDIILGLLHPSEGNIFVDNIDTFLNLKKWQSIIGYVPQSIYLTDDSLINNIAFGLSKEEIDNKKIEEAIIKAQLSKFIESLPERLNTNVGENGVKLSGGQRQRIGIARALYNNPEILIFDEATSSLDENTESEVMKSVDFLKGKITMILIAHRLSTLKNCDRIIQLNEGKIIS